MSMTILDRVKSPADLRGLTRDELNQLASDLRARLIDVCSRTGGHIGAGLGVVELTVALHYAFDTPRDQLVWDVGHQGYPHKVLTGRNERLETLRQEDGISGFLKRTESEYDAFGAGHAATSISAAFGMAAGRDITGGDYKVVATYTGLVPDTFKDGAELVLTGKLGPQGFQATDMTAKCPSKYEAASLKPPTTGR